MKLINHPSIIQDIIDLSLMLPASRDFELDDEGEIENPVIDFLYHVRDLAIKLRDNKEVQNSIYNGALHLRRKGQGDRR